MAQAATSPPFWSQQLDHFGNLLVPLTGDWIKTDAIAGITWLQLFSSAAILILTVAIVEVLRWFTRRKIKKTAKAESSVTAPGHPPVPPSWLRLTLQEAGAPFILFIWIWGLFCVFWTLLFQLPSGSDVALAILSWLKRVGLIVTLFWFFYRMINVVELEFKQWTARTTQKWDDILAAIVVRALRLVAPLLAVLIILPALELPAEYRNLLQPAASLFLIGVVGYIFCELAATAEKIVLTEYRMDVKDNLAMRKIQTQVRVLKKIAVFFIVLLTAASMLMVFDSVRRLGTSLLASAGIAGIIIGFAAQRSLAMLLAGIQIAFTQPIRLDDVVVVEGEWGRIEEITMTYVVVLIWDLRRMILPITYFIEKPFQNWTRAGADLIGSVFLYLDYTVPLSALREELDRILETSKLWDRKVKALQVTDAKNSTLELRVLASAADSSSAWDLRCEIREKLVGFVQRNYPQALPRTRAESWPPFPTEDLNKTGAEEKSPLNHERNRTN